MEKLNLFWKNKSQSMHNRIIQLSVIITLFVVELCAKYNLEDFDILSLLGFSVESSFLKDILHTIIHWVIFTLLFYVTYFVINNCWSLIWMKKNKNLLLQGNWLHIHDKKDVKIGVVNIKQNFKDIEVDAINIKPNQKNGVKTSWRYVGSEFRNNNESTFIYLIGCYFANREDQASKQGVHVFHKPTRWEKNIPVEIKGSFGDALLTTRSQSYDVSDQTGKIYFFKMPKKIEKYIEYHADLDFDYYKLSDILNNSDFKDEPFVVKLKKILNKNEIQKSWESIKERYKENITDISRMESVVAKTLICASFADKNIDDSEIEMFKDITGFEWTKWQIYSYLPANIHEVEDEIRKLISEINDYSIREEFKEMLHKACEALILENNKIETNENGFISSLNRLLGKQTTVYK